MASRTLSVALLAQALVGAGCSTGPATTSARPGAAHFHVAPAAASEGPGAVLLRGARVIDGTGSPPRDDVDVLVEGGRIRGIGPDLQAPTGAAVVELGGRTLLPGFIDAHVHLTYAPVPSRAEAVRRDVQETEADRALRGAAHARATLQAGFTTVRNVGGSLADRALRDAIARGDVEGPTMLVANWPIGSSGGHCDPSLGLRPNASEEAGGFRYGVADGPLEVRKAVRYQIKHGADLVKLCVTAGVLSPGTQSGASQMTDEEVRAAVDEASRRGKRVAAHAHGLPGIRAAVEAGVHSIEHGSALDRRVLREMKRRDIALVPTLYVADYLRAQGDAGRLPEDTYAKLTELDPQLERSFALAREAGVRIVLGSDAGVFAHGHNAREFVALVEGGLSPLQAIVAGTSEAARLLGLPDVGRIEPGLRADLVVVGGDPLTHIELLEQPLWVMKGGVVFRDELLPE